MEHKKIVIVGSDGLSTNIVFNALDTTFGVHKIVLENTESAQFFLKRRIKKLGLLTVIGQILFKIFIVKLLNITSKKRTKQILASHHMDDSAISEDKILRVPSINAESTIELLKNIKPDVIVVNGTRIISKKVLQSVGCKFINTHTGMTPMYRGVHGTYWALANNDLEHSGVTVHFVDEGIDTGNIISQTQVVPSKEDNFVTYPLLQLAAGIELLKDALKNYFDQKTVIQQAKGNSKLYYHPTIWQYLYYRVKRKVK
jgi:methionyl-tRNA formyltransferase